MPRATVNIVQPVGDIPERREFVAGQSAMNDALASLYALCPLIDGVLIEDKALSGASADNIIAHGLGRAYRHIIPVRFSAATTWQLAASTAAHPASKFVNIQVGTASTVSFWVF